MPKILRFFVLWTAMLMALPLQAFALYAASECPMAMAHAAGSSQGDCEGCDSGSACALMNYCHALQIGISADLKQWLALQSTDYLQSLFVSDFQSRVLAPPVPPPRHV